MNYKENCTKGPVFVSGGRFEVRTEKDGELLLTADHPLMRKSRQEREANTSLAAEAFNVLAETGMTPRELANTLAYLSGKLGSLCDTMPDQDPGEPRDSDLSRCRHIIDDMQAKLEEYQPVTPA